MLKRISAVKARQNLGQIMNEVFLQKANEAYAALRTLKHGRKK